jgi:hypothetical protein
MRISPTILFFLSSFLSEHLVLVEACNGCSKSSKSTKSSKSSKSGKSSKSSDTAAPVASPEPLSQAETYFGVLPDEVAASYIPIEGSRGYVSGTPFILGSPAILDTYYNRGVYSLEEAEIICKIKCEENPLCTSFDFLVGPGPEGRDDLQYHQCTFYNPSVGTVLISDALEEIIDSTFFYKEGTLPPLAFEDFACDVAPGPDGVAAIVGCLASVDTPDFDPDVFAAAGCPDLLTEDALTYISPIVTCIAVNALENGEDPGLAIQTCLECSAPYLGEYDAGFLDSCVVNAFVCNDDGSVPGASLIGAPDGVCVDACPSECADELKMAGLCASGAVPEIVLDDDGNSIGYWGGCVSNGIPGLDPFTCPSADSVAPTPEDYAAFLVEKSP